MRTTRGQAAVRLAALQGHANEKDGRTASSGPSGCRRRSTSGAMLVVIAMLVGLAGCQKQEGPAEQAGKEIDKAADKVGQQVDRAGESIQEAARRDKK
jgi:hypothetical protein